MQQKRKSKPDPNLSHTDTHTYWQEKALLFKPLNKGNLEKTYPTSLPPHRLSSARWSHSSEPQRTRPTRGCCLWKKKKKAHFGLMNPTASGVYLASDTISSSPSIFYRAVQPQRHLHCVGEGHTLCSGWAFHSQTKASQAFKTDI